MTITARTGDDEISNLIVPNGAPGYEISAPMDKLGWRASDTRELSFRDCAVPEGNLLGERGKGFIQFLEILDGGRISVAAMGVGLAQGAYDLAVAYAKEREQFGKPIAKFQAVQFALADMAVEIEAGRALTYKAAWLKDEGRPFAKEAAMAKLYTGELSHRAANAALQIHGGYGFMEESRDRPALPRPEDPRDRRGHERGPADGHCAASGSLSESPRPRLRRRAGTSTIRSTSRPVAAMIARSSQAVPPLENVGSVTPSAAASRRTAWVVDRVSAVGVLPTGTRASTRCSLAVGLRPRLKP